MNEIIIWHPELRVEPRFYHAERSEVVPLLDDPEQQKVAEGLRVGARLGVGGCHIEEFADGSTVIWHDGVVRIDGGLGSLAMQAILSHRAKAQTEKPQ